MNPIQTEQLDEIYTGKDSAIARDLKLNLKRILEDGALAPTESLLTLLATATSVGATDLISYARQELSKQEVTSDQINEAAESAAIMAMLNTYYRFRHMVNKDEDYRSAGLRMTGLAKPVLGKEQFEMLALAVSVLNGCESCIKSHEKVLRDSGVSADKIHDLARMASVVKALGTLKSIETLS